MELVSLGDADWTEPVKHIWNFQSFVLPFPFPIKYSLYSRYISGSIHYFRIHPDQWLDRLKVPFQNMLFSTIFSHFQRVRALGFNAIQYYVPWNWHEVERGTWDIYSISLFISSLFSTHTCLCLDWRHTMRHIRRFDFTGGRDFARFSRLAESLGMYTLLRMGPYSCGEWENGGVICFCLDYPQHESDVIVNVKHNWEVKS